MTFDNEMLTGVLRWVDKTDFINAVSPHLTKTLQQQYRCWNAATPLDVRLIWRDVPSVKITELGL